MDDKSVDELSRSFNQSTKLRGILVLTIATTAIGIYFLILYSILNEIPIAVRDYIGGL